MSTSAAKQELDRIRRFLKELEAGQKPTDLASEAGRMRRKLDQIIAFVNNIQE
jgi:hypothetical protein